MELNLQWEQEDRPGRAVKLVEQLEIQVLMVLVQLVVPEASEFIIREILLDTTEVVVVTDIMEEEVELEAHIIQ